MSYNIRNIREISNDPLTKFTNQLAKKLSKFLNQTEVDRLENKEDIYSNAQDIDVVIRYQNFNSTKYFDFLTQYYPPTEPDFSRLHLWLKGRNLGNEIPDKSGFHNPGTLNGDPMLVDGAPFDYGIHTGGFKSIALRFNRPTSDLENEEYIRVPDSTDIQVVGITTGNSYFIRFKIFSLAQQGGTNRTLFEKIDDSTPNDGVQAQITTDGRLLFYLKRAGTVYKNQTAAGTITTNTVYEVWFTYANSGNVVHIYVNNVDKTLTSPADPVWHTPLTDHDLSIFSCGSTYGHLYGDLYDMLMFKQKVVSSTEVSRHYTNKWTLANIAFGHVAVANYFATYYESPSSTSFTSNSFDPSSFTTL